MIVSFFLVTSMVLTAGISPAQSIQRNHKNEPVDDSAQTGLTNDLVNSALEMKKPTLDVLNFSDAIEKGTLDKMPFTDPFYQAGQIVTIKGIKYHVANSKEQRPPKVNKSNLTYKMHSEGKSLIIEGIYGANAKGENGEIVATHEIPFPNEILSNTGMNVDNDLILILTADGSVSSLHRQLLYESLFEPGLPVFSKIWEVDSENQEQTKKFENILAQFKSGNIEFRSHFLTRSTSPGYLNDIENALIVPDEVRTQLAQKTPVEAINHQAGSYYIGWSEKNSTENSEKHLLAIIPRKTIFLGMLRGALIMQQQDFVLHPEEIFKKPEIIQLLKKVEAQFDSLSDDIEEKEISPLVKLVFDKKTKQERQALENAIHSILNSINTKNPVDQFNARQASAFLAKAFQQSEDDSIQEQDIENNFLDVAKMQASALTNPLQKNSNLLLDLITAPASKINEIFLKKVPSAEARSYIGYALAGGVYFGFAYFFKATGGYEFPILTWMYDHGYPAVIKNMSTMNVAITGLIASVSLMPIVQSGAWLTGSLLRGMSKFFQNSNTKFAQHIRRFANDWKVGVKDMTDGSIKDGSSVWQLLTASCLKVTAIFTFPILRAIGNSAAWIAEDILRQKSFVTSIQNGINPFTNIDPKDYSDPQKEGQVTAESENTSKGVRKVGLNNPFLSKQELNKVTQENIQIQNQIRDSKIAKERLALKLAILVVAEQTHISPGEIMATQSLSAKQIEELVSDPEKFVEIKHLDFTILRELQTASAQEIIDSLKQEDSSQFLKFYQKAKETADVINGSRITKFVENTKYFWNQFQVTMKTAMIAGANNGYEMSQKMWKMKASDIDPVKLERIVAEVPADMLFAGVFSSMQGPFADPTHPDRLFGSENFPYLSPTGLYGTTENLTNQMTLGVPAAIMTSDPLIQNKESSYRPIEDFTYSQAPRTESMAGNFINEMIRVHNFKKSDLGGWNNRYFFTRWGFFQYLFLTGFLLRIASFQNLHITLTEAMGTFLAYEMGKWMYYRHLWTYIRVGSMVNRDRYLENIEKLNKYKVTLGRILDKDQINADELESIREYYKEILAVYWKSNPKAMKKIFVMTRKNLSKSEVKNVLLQLDKKEFEHFGIAYQLLQANKELDDLQSQIKIEDKSIMIAQQLEKIDLLQNQLINAISTSEPTQNTTIENIRGMIEMIRTNSPYTTKSHDQYHPLKVLLFGAIATTILGLQLQDKTTQMAFIHDPTQWLTLALQSGTFVFGFWSLTSKKAWDFYSEKWNDVKTGVKQIPKILTEKVNEVKYVSKVAPLIISEKLNDGSKPNGQQWKPGIEIINPTKACSLIFFGAN